MSITLAPLYAAIPVFIGIFSALIIPRIAIKKARFNILILLMANAAFSVILLQNDLGIFLLIGLMLLGITWGSLIAILLTHLTDTNIVNSKQSGLAAENEFAYASYDTYPVSEFHCLIIPKRHVKDYFDLNDNEVIACNNLIKQIKEGILLKDPTVKGFNIGTNSGAIAGQSVLHCHIHLIPRREGDVENPQGGVRSVIPLKQHYKRKA